MKKKFLSLMCAIAMVSTFVASMTIASAATNPSFVAEVKTGEKYVATLPDTVAQYAVVISVADVPNLVEYTEEFNWETYATDITLTAMSALECHLKYDANTFAFNTIITDLTGVTANGKNGLIDFTWSTTDKQLMLSENGEIAKFIFVKKPTGENTEVEFNSNSTASIRVMEYTPTNVSGTVHDYTTIAKNLDLVVAADQPALADFTALNTAIAAAEAVEADKYVSVEAVNAALAAAKAIDQAAETDQAKVDAAAKAINDAIAALELKPVASVNAEKGEVQYGDSTIPGKKIAGFATTVTPANGGEFKKLTANIGNGTVNNDFVIYEGVSINATTVFGLNITQVPEDVTITVNSVKAE